MLGEIHASVIVAHVSEVTLETIIQRVGPYLNSGDNCDAHFLITQYNEMVCSKRKGTKKQKEQQVAMATAVAEPAVEDLEAVVVPSILEEPVSTELQPEPELREDMVSRRLTDFIDHFQKMHDAVEDHEHCIRHHAEDLEDAAIVATELANTEVEPAVEFVEVELASSDIVEEVPSDLLTIRERSKSNAQAEILSIETALRAVGGNLGEFNWLLLEAETMGLYNAGTGGVEELKLWLDQALVLFGVLRLPFIHGGRKVVKHVMLQWMGPKISIVRRGKLVNKAIEAEGRFKSVCPFILFRVEVGSIAEFVLQDILNDVRKKCLVDGAEESEITLEGYVRAVQVEQSLIQRRKALERKKNRQAAEEAAAEKAALEQAEAERVAAERLAIEQAERTKAEKASAEKAAAEKEASEKAEAERLAAEALLVEQAAKEAAEKEAAERAAAEKMAAERAAAEKAAAEARQHAADCAIVARGNSEGACSNLSEMFEDDYSSDDEVFTIKGAVHLLRAEDDTTNWVLIGVPRQ